MLSTILQALGGLGLFLLAMAMLTDGLKQMVGHGLKHLLQRATRSPLRGVSIGAMLTALVQSSSAVTIATIGFVNAGILSLSQALGLIFGANLGTTITGWLVSLTGFDLPIQSLALQIIAIGSILRLFIHKDQGQGLGIALIGFGLFFLGLDVLMETFKGLSGQINLAAFGAGDLSGIFIMLIIGFVITALTQSSSAAMALIITAASGGVLSLPAAAAAIIGANLGTTTTAILASITATNAARRVALGHIAFNVITAILALMILPFLIYGIRKAGAILHLPGSTEATLALFHTAFNLLGLLILFPFIDQIAAFLNRRFRSSDEDMAQPVFLDKTLHQMPILAISALLKESTRLQQLSENLILDAFLADRKKPDGLAKEAQALKVLGTAISEFPGQLNTASLSMESTGDISQILRTTRYLQDAVSLAPRIAGIQGKITGLKDDQTRQLCCATLDEAKKTIKAGQESPQNTSALIEALQQFENSYRDTKAALLENAARGLIDIERLQSILDNLSQLRRLVQQMSKASRTLNIITNKNSEQGA